MAAVPAGAVSPLRAALYLRLSRDDAGGGEDALDKTGVLRLFEDMQNEG